MHEMSILTNEVDTVLVYAAENNDNVQSLAHFHSSIA